MIKEILMGILKKLFPVMAVLVLMCGCDYDDYDSEETHETRVNAAYTNDDEALYQVIYDHLSDFKYDSIKFYGYPADDKVFDIVQRVVYEHPEFFWIDDSFLGRSYPKGYTDMELNLRGDELPIGRIREMCDEVSEQADRIIHNIPVGASDWEKILFVHDEIVRNTWYQDGDEDEFTDTVYGCLVNGRTQSAGYAQAFQYIMERMGFECGMFSNGGHTWNYIRLDGKYYWIDLAYDDPDFGEDVYYNYTHNYFMCDDGHLSENHDLSKGDNRFVPKCDSFDKYFYIVDGSYMTEYNADRISEIIAKHSSEEQIEIKFENEKDYKDAIEGIRHGVGAIEFMKADIDLSELSYCWIDDWLVIKLLLGQRTEEKTSN